MVGSTDTAAVMSTRARENSKKLIICKERLNRLFEELIQLCAGPAELLEIEDQISMTERLYRETDALQVEVELGLEEEQRKMAEDDWSKYRRRFRERKARALALMRSNGTDQPGRLDDQGDAASRSGPEVVTAATSVHELTARLPRYDLPKYSGDFAEFRAFWDQFDYRVHQRKDLSNTAKLTYLRGCLTGKPGQGSEESWCPRSGMRERSRMRRWPLTCQNISNSWESRLSIWKSRGQIDRNPPSPISPKLNAEAALPDEDSTVQSFSTLSLRIGLPTMVWSVFLLPEVWAYQKELPGSTASGTLTGAASGRSTSGLCNSDISGQQTGTESKTVEPRKAQAVAHGSHGRKRLLNCLFDTGAERSLFRQDIADELKLAGETHPISFCGVGGSRISCQALRLVRFWLSSVSGERAEERYELEAMTVPMLCEDLWQTQVSPKDWPHL
ncbi:hypothetical protein T02_12265 [Trichinella nativa]|uniref:Peptidase A2 domain-containing protein n=1 Tax=Trichinella nativa TaxID=6335 RepID=A0A0V1LC86_9BILA|nr:hypothetical protein T02_12265 [Trichinella nativa]